MRWHGCKAVIPSRGDTLCQLRCWRMVGHNPDTGSIRWEVPLASPRGVNDVERLVELVGRVSRVGDSVCARAFQVLAVGCVNITRDRASVSWTQRSAVGRSKS